MLSDDELRALADALAAIYTPDPKVANTLDSAEAYLRACTDAKPVAWMHDGLVSTNKEKVEHDEMRNRSCGFKPKPIVPLYAHPAAPQAEPKREDRAVRDLLAIIHCDGGHHTEAVGLDQSIKDAQAAVCELKRELAMEMREPGSEPTEAQIVAVADVLLAWEAEISNRVSARVLAEDVIRAALAAKENNDAE